MNELHNSEPIWPRPYHTRQPDAPTAKLMYLVVGAAPAEVTVTPGLVVSVHHRDDDPDWFDAWLTGPLGREIDMFFLRPEEIRSANVLTVIRGEFSDPRDLTYLQNAIHAVSAIAQAANAQAIFDAYALMWWRWKDWREAFVDKAEFAISDHIAIAVTDEPTHHPGLWIHTRGMIKFARPEVEIRHLPGPYASTNPAINAATDVLYRVAGYMALGELIESGRLMRQGDARMTLVEHADPQTHRHFNNTSLEVRDIDPATGKPGEGASLFLEEVAQRNP